MKKFLFFSLFIVVSGVMSSQDLHFSQFYNSPLNINPALTGIFNGDKRINLSYRNQWKDVPVEWMTFSASYDQKFYPKKERNSFFSGGLLFNYDRQGLSELNLSNLNVGVSYTSILNKNNLITIGGTLGFASRGFDPTSLTWDSQWNGFEFDPTAASGENFDADRISFFETSLGVNYRWQKSHRTKLDLGIGAFHIIEPGVAFYSADSKKLPMRISLSGAGSFMISDGFDIQLHGLAQFQDAYREYLVGALGIIHVSQKRGKEAELHLGVQYRTGASLAPTFAIQYKNLYGAISYDIDATEFNVPQDVRLGSLEIHFRTIISTPRPQRLKVCPIF